MTSRQGEIARRLLIDGWRQADVAAELGVSRATISVTVARSRIGAIAAARRLLVTALGGMADANEGGTSTTAVSVVAVLPAT